MSSVIAASGEKGHRKIYPLSRVMLHQVSGGYRGNVQDARVNYKEMERINDLAMEHLAKCCGKDLETLKADCERDAWFSSEEIVAYGMVDKITEPR
jgi:ATP-dependent Clp protease protease subunit